MPKAKRTLYIAVQTEPNAVGSHYTSNAQTSARKADAYWSKPHQVVKIEIEIDVEKESLDEKQQEE